MPGSAALLVLVLGAGLSFLGCLGAFGPALRTTRSAVALYLAGSAGIALLGLRACTARSFARAAATAAAAGRRELALDAARRRAAEAEATPADPDAAEAARREAARSALAGLRALLKGRPPA